MQSERFKGVGETRRGESKSQGDRQRVVGRLGRAHQARACDPCENPFGRGDVVDVDTPVETSRGDAAAATWIRPWRRVAATPRLGYSVETSARLRYEQADFDLRRERRPDYYALLGCRKVSSEREIKAAYWAKSLVHHPDKHATAPADEQKKHEEAFKHLGMALDILGDPQKRELYDKGFDKEAIHQKLEAAKRAANNTSGCCGGGCGSGGCG